MRKTFFILAFLLALSFVGAQPADVQVTYSGMIPQILVWEPVTTDADGNALLPGDTVGYEVFFTKAPFNPSEAQSLGVVMVAEATIDLSSLSRGYYYVGARAIGTDAGGAVTYTGIAWSNDTVAVSPLSRFAYLVTGGLLLPAPSGLRTVP